MSNPGKFTNEEQAQMALVSKVEAKGMRKAKRAQEMAYFVLGHKADNAKLWDTSLLASIMVTPAGLKASNGAPPVYYENIAAPLPPQIGFGIGAPHNAEERALLFRYLPEVTLQQAAEIQRTNKARIMTEPRLIEDAELSKVKQLAKIIDLQNASGREIRAENTRRCIASFGEFGVDGDSGRSEVQAALLTVRIRTLWDSVQKHGMTPSNRIALRKMCYDRKRMLRYLKRLDRDRYDICLQQLGLERDAVENELFI
ncbi:hypothetical protein BKA62DRAFT_681687 [Auriculariales sp. MPI-PUGE-AT-0066]|nr:hypothetical protein BKA62DRAFT_681687 [Auriculariales sp. MPI-PUGE-AT-0066]